mgnify:CR=1 FL=1
MVGLGGQKAYTDSALNTGMHIRDNIGFRLYNSALLDFGGKLSRNDLFVDLPERGAHAEFNGLYLAGDGQHGLAVVGGQYRAVLFAGQQGPETAGPAGQVQHGGGITC